MRETKEAKEGLGEQLGPLTRKIDDFLYARGHVKSKVFKPREPNRRDVLRARTSHGRSGESVSLSRESLP